MGKSWPGAVVVMSSILLAGCAGPGGPSAACPAIGWSNRLLVELEGNTSSVAEVQACVDGECPPPAPTPVKPDTAPASIPPPETPGGTGGQSGNVQDPVPPTQRTIMPFSSTRVESDRWRIDVGMSAPEQVTLRALDADGDVLAEEDFPLEWVRVGGSEQCGGPGEAGPVTLSVP